MGNITTDQIKDLIASGVGVICPQDIEKKATNVGMFHLRNANERMDDARKLPPSRRMWRETSLFFENELTLVFASTGLGKTVWALQVANDISSTDKVLYLDLELSDVQFRKRYTDNFTNDFHFNDNLYIVNFQRRFSIPDGSNYDQFFLDSLKELLNETGAKIVFIDNMTRLISADTDKAQNAKPLMDKLNDIKFDYGLTMVLLEHSRKTDNSRPISINDLQGSKMKVNFADAVICIGQSARDKSLRYVKQLKVRSSELEYDDENVVIYELDQRDSFLQFVFMDYGREREHLSSPSEVDRDTLIDKVKEMLEQGNSQRYIANELGIAVGTVNKYSKL